MPSTTEPLSEADVRSILNGTYGKKKSKKSKSQSKDWGNYTFFAHSVNLECTSIDEALDAFGLNWEVEAVNLRSDEPDSPEKDGIEFFDHKGIIRTDNNFPLSTVGASIYQPIQNRRCMELIEDILEEGRLVIESGGVFDHGRRVWIACRLPEEVKISFKSGDNQTVLRYIHLSWSHDQSQAVTVSFMPYIKERKISLASFAPEGVPTSISFKHTTFASLRMDQGADIMRKALNFFEKAEDMLQGMASQSMTPKRFEEMLNFLYPDNEDEELDNNGKQKKTSESKKRAGIRDRWEKLPADLQFTDFGALIAISEHSDFDGRNVVRGSGSMSTEEKEQKIAEKKLDSSLFGVSQKNKLKAVKAIFNFDKIKAAGGITK